MYKSQEIKAHCNDLVRLICFKATRGSEMCVPHIAAFYLFSSDKGHVLNKDIKLFSTVADNHPTYKEAIY